MIAALIKIINKQIVEAEDKVIFGQDELINDPFKWWDFLCSSTKCNCSTIIFIGLAIEWLGLRHYLLSFQMWNKIHFFHFFWESNTFLSRFLNLMLVLFHQQRLTPLSWKDNRFYKKKFYATWINSNEFIAYKDETSTIVGWKKYRIHGWMCSFNICRIGFLYYTLEKLVTN